MSIILSQMSTSLPLPTFHNQKSLQLLVPVHRNTQQCSILLTRYTINHSNVYSKYIHIQHVVWLCCVSWTASPVPAVPAPPHPCTVLLAAVTHIDTTHIMQLSTLARTITRFPRSVSTSQLLCNLHWLPIHKRIHLKVATLTYKRFSLLNNQLISITLQLTTNPVITSCFQPVSPACSQHKNQFSPLLPHKSGTVYLLLSESHHHLIPSNVTSKITILPHHSTFHLVTPPHLRFNFFNFGVLPNFFYITLHCYR